MGMREIGFHLVAGWFINASIFQNILYMYFTYIYVYTRLTYMMGTYELPVKWTLNMLDAWQKIASRYHVCSFGSYWKTKRDQKRPGSNCMLIFEAHVTVNNKQRGPITKEHTTGETTSDVTKTSMTRSVWLCNLSSCLESRSSSSLTKRPQWVFAVEIPNKSATSYTITKWIRVATYWLQGIARGPHL